MENYFFGDKQPSSSLSESDTLSNSAEAAERELVAFQQRHADDRSLGDALAIVEQAISEIRQSRRG